MDDVNVSEEFLDQEILEEEQETAKEPNEGSREDDDIESYLKKQLKFREGGPLSLRELVAKKLKQDGDRSTQREIRDLKRSVCELTKHVKSNSSRNVDSEITRVRSDLDAAYEDGDKDRVIELSGKLAQLELSKNRETERRPSRASARFDDLDVEEKLEDFFDENEWAGSDKDMQLWVKQKLRQYGKSDASIDESLRLILLEAKHSFPSLFKNGKRERSEDSDDAIPPKRAFRPSVSGGGRPVGGNSISMRNIPPEEREPMRGSIARMVSEGKTQEEAEKYYLNDFAKRFPDRLVK